MKKFSLFLILICCVSMAKAQLTVNSDGNVGIGTTPNDHILSIFTHENGLKCQVLTNSTTTTTSPKGIEASCITYNATYGVGVEGSANTTNSGNSPVFGVRGFAKGALNGRNVGVYGFVPVNYNGTGIWGSDHSMSIPTLSERFAGYFNGKVKVAGDMEVTGSINGVVVSNLNGSNGSFASRMEPFATERASSALFGLRTSSVYLEKINNEAVNSDDINDKSLQDIDEINLDDTLDGSATGNRAADMTELSLREKQVLSKQHYCLDADQLEEVFPDLVYENEDGSKSINYVEMVPILVQAINELKAELTELRGSDEKPQTRASEGDEKRDEMGENVTLLSLGENRPNPFSNTTAIPVSIPEDVQRAFIYVYDLTGKKVQQVDIPARGKENITLDASALTDGMYLYSLIADGKVVQTRRMIVEK